MRDMLYINGQLVDLSEGVDITLNYKSNLLTDLGKIVGNNSYTIKLPKTSRNLGIIGISDIPSVVSSFPRVSHPARYFRNGVELIPDGRAVLLSVGDSIEVALSWGGASAFYKLTEDDRNLNEFNRMSDFLPWSSNASPFAYNGVDKVLYSDIDVGLSGLSDFGALHPCVRSTYIFDLIEREYGLKILFTSDRESFIHSLLVPLLTNRGGYVNEVYSELLMTYSSNDTVDMTSPYGWVVTGQGAEMGNYFRVQEFDFDDVVGNETVQNVVVKSDCHLVFTPSIRHSSYEFKILYSSGGNDLDMELSLPYSLGSDGKYVFDTPVELDLMEGDAFRLDTHFVEYGSWMRVVCRPDAVKVGERFPIVENLPEFKVVDFLKAVASVSGTFAVPSSDGSSVSFIPFDRLGDRGAAVDWSGKLMARSELNVPYSLEYKVGDLARNNYMRWKSDDSVKVKANGNIRVEDMNLDFEQEAVELPFAASDIVKGKAKIRLYEYNDEGVPELQDVEPRLLVEKNVGGYSTGTFEGLHWDSLLSKYYGTYQNAVKSPVVITEEVMLDELSLRDLDMSVPVYLRQYGRYYAVVEVKAPSNGVCECKLLQLSV